GNDPGWLRAAPVILTDSFSALFAQFKLKRGGKGWVNLHMYVLCGGWKWQELLLWWIIISGVCLEDHFRCCGYDGGGGRIHDDSFCNEDSVEDSS
nr:hypothetical protein [Tanacetum cinerariifolium]